MSKENKNYDSMRVLEDVIGCKWTMSVIDGLQRGYHRPGVLKKAIPGVSGKVLNERLQKLLRFELIRRKVYPVIPPRVEYSFTTRGRKFLKVLDAIKLFNSK